MPPSTTAQPYEAYVIEADGTQRSIPINFASNARSFTPEKPRLHLARRACGIALITVGVPMLILPGPGIAAIVIGAAMAFRK